MTSAGEAHLEPRLVGDISGRFYVPAYQRGFRWGAAEVRRLLDDIWGSPDQPYYLQPVVVKPHGDEWELVDGQQRLATLFLIFQFMRREGLQSTGAGYSLRYETREGSAAYLEELDPEQSRQNVDYFHIYESYRCIRDWFDAHGSRRQHVANKFYGALFEQVRVIWYEAADDLDAVTLFTRLNVGRIPLTDAELIKALLLSRSRDGPGVTDRALEIAAQWDAIERDLRNPELWAFVTGTASPSPTHISLLLDTIAGGPSGRERPPFHTFETLRERIADLPQEFWNQVVDLHSLVVGWYANRDLFHKIGYLVTQGLSLRGLIEFARNKAKSKFETDLDELIRDRLRLSEADLRELGYDKADKASQVLLLMNVETIRSRKGSSERYSFREHAAGRWSLEHIHAQNAEQLSTVEQWTQWLQLHRKALLALDDIDPATKTAVLERVDSVLAGSTLTEGNFRPCEREMTALLSAGDASGVGGVDSIANLALIERVDNSALRNSVFAVKRAVMIDRDRKGSYIPVCTRNVFLKYYSPAGEHQMQFWSADDREHYLDEILDVLRAYLLPGVGVAP